ncbi:MAG: T9SS type A sorting domain-containing protein [Bacteroidota bacterium]
MKIKKVLAILLFLSPSFLVAQERIVPATINVERAMENRKDNRYIAKSGELITLPFIDDFSTDYFPGNEEGNPILWEQRNAVLNRGLALNAPTYGVVSFDGTDEFGLRYDSGGGTGPADTLTSCPINLEYESDDGIGISFYFQPKGNSSSGPNAQNDSLILEFYAPELDEWLWVWSTLDLSDLEDFTFVYLPITDNRFLKEGFKFRFRNIAFLDGLFSVWNIDYVWIDQNSINDDPIVNDVAFIDGPITFLEEYSAMPFSHYEVDPEARMIENTSVRFRNLNDDPRTLEGNEIVFSFEGAEQDVIANPNTPAIGAMSTANYAYQLTLNDDQYVYDTSLSEDEITFGVNINLGTIDFSETSSNNTWDFEQEFGVSYSYDDGSAETAYFVSSASGSSRSAIRYRSFLSDSICALRIYTMPISGSQENSPFTIKVWEDNGGFPGEELASASQQLMFGQNEYQETIIYEFEEPVFVPSGTFFVGLEQPSTQVRVGIDLNTSGNDNGNLVFDSGNGWQATIIFANASIMMHPMFYNDCRQDLVSTVDRDIIPGLRLYPNPAENQVTLLTEDGGNLDVSILDLSGRLISNQITSRLLDVSELQSGLYLVRVTDSKGRIGTKKLVIER